MHTEIEASLTITNTTPSGSAFAIVHSPIGANCFVPMPVASSIGGVKCGDTFKARVIENPHAENRHKTPYMAVFLQNDRQDEADLALADVGFLKAEKIDYYSDAKDFLHEKMKTGVWTISTMFDAYLAERKPHGEAHSKAAYKGINNEMQDMFERGESSRIALYNSPDQLKASRVWYTCTPSDLVVDVM